jgi:hydrogenase maturation protein HypF
MLNAPPAALIKSIEISPAKVNGYSSFKISGSKSFDNQITEISPDIAVCSDCREDLEKDPERIDYPFINCTNCGPRFTIIEGLPYDRSKTTMKSFTMCRNCNSEYNDILNRRFHAQHIACNACGPVYHYKDPGKELESIEEILVEIALLIASGRSVAIKGVGGYHLMCDALNNIAVSELRLRKQRDQKPFAVMFRDVSAVRKYCYLDESEQTELESWRRPILILKQREVLSDAVSNGLGTTGVILPYMPLHYLLFKRLETPAIVFTSGNISDEPVIIDDRIAEQQLMSFADSVVSYNREIFNRTDDSVVRFIDDKKCLYRRSRGFVPRPVDLISNVEGIIAFGAEQKNSICLGKGNQAIMSQYIGDLKNPVTYNFFTDTIERLSRMMRFKPEVICCDLHPDYLSTSFAEIFKSEINKPVVRIQHHHAHIASCLAENGIDKPVIGISLDGTGYGPDENIWGGEFMIADLNSYDRIFHFDYVPMPGGEKAVTEPWRMALSYIFKYLGESFDYDSVPLFKSIDKLRFSMAREMIIKKINTPMTSGAGRLFDAVAAILGLCPVVTFDSEAPMKLESIIDKSITEVYPFGLGKTVVFADTIRAILNDLPHRKAAVISAKFHNTIAQVILEASKNIRSSSSLKDVVLSGGVFQNKYLTERSVTLLRQNGFNVFTNHLVPVNDGGISLGQLIIASKKRGLCV